MTTQTPSPDAILPMRFRLTVPEDSTYRFSVLDSPYANALKTFMARFENIYKHENNGKPYYGMPYRQLNDGLLALCPGLIQGFEPTLSKGRMVTFTRYDTRGEPEDFPTEGQLRSFIIHWLQRWAQQADVQPIVKGAGQSAWQELFQALNGTPETQWQHGIAPIDLANDLTHESYLAFIALPALLTALLHETTMTVPTEKEPLSIIWRRAHDGGNKGLHLVSQPMRKPLEDDYYAYRLDFSVQTQTGYVYLDGRERGWIFANLSIQRYITEKYHPVKGDKRALSVLVGFNNDGFTSTTPSKDDSTLIRLRLERTADVFEWADGVGDLLNSFNMRHLPEPAKILEKPIDYGNYSFAPNFKPDEYYVVYAEGRKFGDDSERQHQVKTGTSLRERSQIMREVLDKLQGWLELSQPLELDSQVDPKKTFAMRDYKHMVNGGNYAKKQATWRNVLTTSLANSGHSHLQLVVLYRNTEFQGWVQEELDTALMGLHQGDNPLISVHYVPLPASYYYPLDPGELDPALLWDKNRPKDFWDKWDKQMSSSYQDKREQWRTFLKNLDWEQNARRLVLIDSTGEPSTPDSQQIKGAVRDACHREGILSQFVVGDNLRIETKPKNKRFNHLDYGSRAKLRNAIFDLLLRQQGLLYAPPSEIYAQLAHIPADIAAQLDIIAFCHLKRNNPKYFQYVLAVRLRANTAVDVLLPHDTSTWIPYDLAAAKLGKLFSDERVLMSKPKAESLLRLKNSDMVNFVYTVLTQKLERPTIAVIESENWRNGRGQDDTTHCWTQLRNTDLLDKLNVLDFGLKRVYERQAPALDCLLAVVRLRMNNETPHYISADNWSWEEDMRDIPHLTGYVDKDVTEPMHYFSVAGLPETQKKQKDKNIAESFKAHTKQSKFDEIAFKHAQLVEMLPFFVHPDFQSDEGVKQIARCVHFLRISPAFVMGNILKPYPMHLGDKLIEDQLVIIGVND